MVPKHLRSVNTTLSDSIGGTYYNDVYTIYGKGGGRVTIILKHRLNRVDI